MNHFTESDKLLLIASLENGIGFTSSCELNLYDPKTISDYINNNIEFKTQCVQAIKDSVRTNLEFAQHLRNEKRHKEWQRQTQYIKSFISDLTLWESYCKKEEVDFNKVMKASMIYKTLEECSTAIGMTKFEFIDYCFSDESLSLYFNQRNIYKF